MPKFIIKWDIGYGENAEAIEADDIEKARNAAYEAAREEFENSAAYSAEPWTKDEAENLNLDTEETETAN